MKRLFSTVLFLCYKCGLYPGLEHVRGPGPHRPGEGLQVEVAVEDGDWCGQGVAATQQPLLVLVVDPLQILQGETLLLLPQILVTLPSGRHFASASDLLALTVAVALARILARS